MEAVVPAEVTAKRTQILSSLVLGDNEIRSNAEKVVNERLAQTPEVYVLALTQFATRADTEVMRSFSLVLIRPAPSPSPHKPHASSHLTLYDHLSSQTLTTLERLLLHSLAHEPSSVVRHAALTASVSYLSAISPHSLPHALELMYPILDTIPSLPTSQLPRYVSHTLH
ncbi:uncharacterized protein STEHIDRAFT_163313 [Stereum hirsutum FP-91666 SS1]|uniref:Clathrin/coatomer adaptor adaptin-like N-terminal domain-containing protein n=1 Tax=Stereum hirsutum (strain FP-91666) TaxID=721885 RepID=R7RXY2_STEHR|nr:uncharacterized protein STEHIDRAFT_163313 [Stereum hirsutum FP-91666 SS1]EIM79755.1 hypothetical protein STEHIDRAFT_163313 [Stereum hirsutum FP-91666 SS1]